MCNIFLNEALKEAEKALMNDEVPVGAVIVKNEEIIARAHNERELRKDPTAHAEIIAIRKACEALNDWRLNGCSLYVTLEPCPMCAGAILQSRVSKLHIGTFDPAAGACGSVVDLIGHPHLNPKIIVNWMYDDRCSDILTEFFKNKRK